MSLSYFYLLTTTEIHSKPSKSWRRFHLWNTRLLYLLCLTTSKTRRASWLSFMRASLIKNIFISRVRLETRYVAVPSYRHKRISGCYLIPTRPCKRQLQWLACFRFASSFDWFPGYRLCNFFIDQPDLKLSRQPIHHVWHINIPAWIRHFRVKIC